VITPEVIVAFQQSAGYGQARLEEIVRTESAARGFSADLVRRYLTRHIACDVGEKEQAGMELFLSYAREFGEAGSSLVQPA
jgi:hypothetical protein